MHFFIPDWVHTPQEALYRTAAVCIQLLPLPAAWSVCDELGLMVCDDRMFGNKWESGTYDFEQETEYEAECQTMKLRSLLTISA